MPYHELCLTSVVPSAGHLTRPVREGALRPGPRIVPLVGLVMDGGTFLRGLRYSLLEHVRTEVAGGIANEQIELYMVHRKPFIRVNRRVLLLCGSECRAEQRERRSWD